MNAPFASLVCWLLLAFGAGACSSSSTPADEEPLDASPPSDADQADAGANADADEAGSQPTVWLCRPGLASNPCEAPRGATAIAADGAATPEAAEAGGQPIDCFYVYPTVSAQPGINADLTIDPAETGVAIAQASRFSEVCRVFAPMYRQITLAGLFSTSLDDAARERAYADVVAAWKDYLANDNQGRGVVLVGHSQGAYTLDRLIAEHVDGDDAVRAKLVSALLIGGNVRVPEGADVGVDFQHVPACRARDQVGCVVGYSSFDEPPGAGSRFGRTVTPGARVLCTNPADLAGSASADLHPYFPTSTGGSIVQPPGGGPAVATPWVTYPGLFRASCKEQDGASWLQIDDVRAAGDVRPKLAGSLGPSWGLHLYDVNVALGDLVALVKHQAIVWAAPH
jgi:hypothetical protein